VSDRLGGRPVPPLARASARKRAYTEDGTNDGTSTQRRTTTTQDERAYHLKRIINSFKTTISPEKARQLRRLLGVDDTEAE
jgi:hypothetical protein